VDHVNVGLPLDHFAAHVGGRGMTRRSEGQRSRFGLSLRNQLRHRMNLGRWMHYKHVIAFDDRGDWNQVTLRIVV
jgi:hypothetical protein